MSIPYSKNKAFEVDDREELYHNSNQYVSDAACLFFEVWGENSVPELIVVKDYNEYDDGDVTHKVVYHHPNGETTKGYIGLDEINNLLNHSIIKDAGYHSN